MKTIKTRYSIIGIYRIFEVGFFLDGLRMVRLKIKGNTIIEIIHSEKQRKILQ